MQSRAYSNAPNVLAFMRDTAKFSCKRFSLINGEWSEQHYGNSFLAIPDLIAVENIRHLSGLLCAMENDPHSYIIRALPLPEFYDGRKIQRTKITKENQVAMCAERDCQIVMLDTDKLPLPVGMRLIDDPLRAIQWVLGELGKFLPGFAGVTCHVQLSASAGLQYIPGSPKFGKPEEISLHVWLFLDRGYSNFELKRWVTAANARFGGKLIDPATITNGVQPCFTAAPLFTGLQSPLAQRSWLLTGDHETATPVIPPEAEIKALVAFSGVQSTIPHGTGYADALEMIGDDRTFKGKAGFQEPIRVAAAAAVDEGIDPAHFMGAAAARVHQYAGSRSEDEIARYSSQSFILDKFKHYADRRRQQELEARERLSKSMAEAETRTLLTLAEGAAELERQLSRIMHRWFISRAARSAFSERLASAKTIISELPEDDYSIPTHCRLKRDGETLAPDLREIRKEVLGLLGLDAMPGKSAPAYLIRCTVGLGKTSQLLAMLKLQFSAVDWYGPNYELIEETFDKYSSEAWGLPGRVIMGRGQDDPLARMRALGDFDGDGSHLRMCPRWKAAAAVARRGDSVAFNLCGAISAAGAPSPCMFLKQCGYWKQTQPADVPHVNFFPHANLARPHRIDMEPADLVVVDEAASSVSWSDTPLSLAPLFEPARAAALVSGHLPADKLDDFFALVKTLPPSSSGEFPWEIAGRELARVATILRECICGRMRTRDVHHRPVDTAIAFLEMFGCAITGMTDAQIVADAESAAVNDRRTMITLLKQLQRCMTRGVELSALCKVDEGKRTVRVATFTEAHVPRKSTLIVLDATGDPDLLSAIFGRPFEVIDITVQENMHVKQITAATGSKFELEHVGRREHLLQKFKEHAAGRSALIVTHKSTSEYLKKLGLPDGFQIAHYGALRGLNAFEQVECIFVMGRQIAPLEDLERMRAAHAANGGFSMPFVAAADYRRLLGSDVLMDKSGYFHSARNPNELFHPDAIVNALLRESFINEIIQGIGRARAARRAGEPVDVVIVGGFNVPGLVIDEAELFSEFMKARRYTKAQEFVRFKLGANADHNAIRVQSLSDRAMMSGDPMKFPTAKAAQKARKQMGNVTPAMIEELSDRGIPQSTIHGNLRIDGERGNATSFVSAMPKFMTFVEGWHVQLFSEICRHFGGAVNVENWAMG